MDEATRKELIETLRYLASEVDSYLENGYLIAYYVYKLADIIEGGTEE